MCEDHYFYDHMTVNGQVILVGSFYERWDKELFDKLLKRFNVDKTKK